MPTVNKANASAGLFTLLEIRGFGITNSRSLEEERMEFIFSSK